MLGSIRFNFAVVAALSVSVFVNPLLAGDAVPQPRSVVHYLDSTGGGYQNLFLPFQPPLNGKEIERWTVILGASDAQQLFIESEYGVFVSDMNRRLDQTIPDYLEASLELAETRATSGTRSDDYLDAIEENLRHRNQVVDELHQVERSYIDSLLPILTNEQATRIPAVHARAERQWYCSDSLPTRGVDVDLFAIWMSVDRDSIDADTRLRIEQMLCAHEVNLTRIYRQVEREHHRRMVETRRNMLRVQAGELASDAFARAHRRQYERRADNGRRIRTANLMMASQIAELLPDSLETQWDDRIRSATFPEVYPVEFNLTGLFQALEGANELDELQRDSLSRSFDAYTDALKRINAELESRIFDWGDQAARGVDGYQRQFLPEALEPLLTERKELAYRHLVQIQEVIDEQTLLQYSEFIPQSLQEH